MTVNLTKGAKVSLSKDAAGAPTGLMAAMVGLGWDTRATDGADFDLDAVVFLLGADGKVREDGDFIFFNNLEGAGGAVVHQGDNLDGAGDGDDEQVLMNLPNIPADVQKAIIAVTIHDADTRGQNFGQVSNAFVRIVNAGSGEEMLKFDLGEDASTETAMIFGEVYRHGDEWKFAAVGQGFAGGLSALAGQYGVNV